MIPVLVGLATVGGCRTESRTEKARRDADPKAVEYLVGAEELLKSGFYNDALVLADSAEALAPELADVTFLRGRILSTMRQYVHAQTAYERTLELDPEYPGVYLNLGNIEYLRDEPRAALNLYRKERGDALESMAYLIQLGRVYADLGIADSARIAYETAIAADTSNPTAYMWMGQLLEDSGSLDEALSYSRKGLSLRPSNLNYAYLLGVQLMRSGDLAGAAEILEKVCEGLPWHYPAHYNLGQALTGLGETERGARYLARADTLHQKSREIARWESLLSTNSHEPMLWVNYGNSLRTAGRIDDAIQALSIAFSLNPDWLEIQNNIANLLLTRGDTTEALTRYQGLLAVDSTLSDVWLNVGTVHALAGDYRSARRAWESALRQDPGNPEAREYLSQLPPP